jgi:hypothetical protein
MTYLRYRNSLERFDNRPGIKRKLKAVEREKGVATTMIPISNMSSGWAERRIVPITATFYGVSAGLNFWKC